MHDARIVDLSPVTKSVTDKESTLCGLDSGRELPDTIRRRIERCVCESIDVLVERGLITSGDVLAEVLPQVTSELRAAGIADGPFLDDGYDATAGAFHIGRIDFQGIAAGNVNLIIGTDPNVFIGNNGMQLLTSYGSATINVMDKSVLIGDVNLDGMVTLLDVSPFIDRITTGTYQAEADCNQDGLITLLDVAPFIDAIQFP